MLYLVGLGLGDVKDITVKGLEIVKRSEEVFLENYTSILGSTVEELEEFYGRKVITVDREMMEQGCDRILDSANEGNAAVLVVGDPLNATTHTDLLLRAHSRKIPYEIIHNASILNAVACCGLQIYNFGETVSIPFWTDTWKPESYYDKIMRNQANGLHTLCLLDIKVKEPNLDLLIRGITKMEPARFMTLAEAATQLVEIIKNRRQEQGSSDHSEKNITENSLCIGLARVGGSDQKISKTTLIEATKLDLGGPLHSLVIPGSMHPLEEEMVDLLSR